MNDRSDTLAAESERIRFAFGRNWRAFSRLVTEPRIGCAEASLASMLGMERLAGKRFLDVGCGSGLFSLAAHRMGARVCSFDIDPESVECTQALKARYGAPEPEWTIVEGSILDRAFMERLGRFDIVYAWGVLHHSGDMMEALGRAMAATAPGGTLFIAIYNDQGWISRAWRAIKRLYNRHPASRPLLIGLFAPYFVGLRWVVRTATGRRRLERGMSLWHDMIDWLGGYPFEVAKPERIVARCRDRGFVLERLKTCGGRSGCNEFVFQRNAENR